ncbi:MAG: hypothetical protein ACI4EK_01795 [Wujia sp.]
MILYNAGKVKAFENLKALAIQAEETEEFAVLLWQDLLADEALLEEFNYFVVHQTLQGKVSYNGLTLLDLYFSQMNKYNILHDMGKNPYACNKNRVVLHAFRQMVDMRRDPKGMQKFEENENRGIDRYFM